MTDARLPGRWLTDPRMDSLSDRAWRIWTNALMFSAEQGTDGLVIRRSFRYLHEHGVEARVLDELLDAGLVEITDDAALQVVDWAGSAGQSPDARVQQQRLANRERQARSRARRKDKDMGDTTGDVTRYDGGEDRRGQDRTGEAQEHAGVRENVTPMWETRQPGSGVL